MSWWHMTGANFSQGSILFSFPPDRRRPSVWERIQYDDPMDPPPPPKVVFTATNGPFTIPFSMGTTGSNFRLEPNLPFPRNRAEERRARAMGPLKLLAAVRRAEKLYGRREDSLDPDTWNAQFWASTLPPKPLTNVR